MLLHNSFKQGQVSGILFDLIGNPRFLVILFLGTVAFVAAYEIGKMLYYLNDTNSIAKDIISSNIGRLTRRVNRLEKSSIILKYVNMVTRFKELLTKNNEIVDEDLKVLMRQIGNNK